jgi:hypothetical protein
MLIFTGLEMTPVLEAGEYSVFVGPSAMDTQTASFRLK